VHSRNVSAAMAEGSACSDCFAFRDEVSYHFNEVCDSAAIFLSQILHKGKLAVFYNISYMYMPCSQIYCKMSTMSSAIKILKHVGSDGPLIHLVTRWCNTSRCYGMVRNIYVDCIFQWHMMLMLICTVLDSTTFSEMLHSKNIQ
jgi:hypothetical protein